MPNIAAVILAAGESSRLGCPKQLIQFRGQSLICRAVNAATEAGCAPILVVCGSDTEKMKCESEKTQAIIVQNPAWSRGIGSSIRSGIKFLVEIPATNVDSVVLLVCDQPFVDANVIRELIAVRQRTNKSIVASVYQKTRGVPALFDSSCFPELLSLKDSAGAKSIILSNPERVATFPFPQGAIDIDSTRDYDKLVAAGSITRSS